MIYTTLSLALFAMAHAVDPVPAGISVDPNAQLEIDAEYRTNDAVDSIGRAAGTQYYTKWSCPIPFVLDPNVAWPSVIIDAMGYITRKTGWTFQPRGNEADYIEFVDEGGCWSYLGKVGGKQQISITNGCPFGSIVHEIGHALGIKHEQSRADRDSYVDIIYANMDLQYASNFDKFNTYNSGDYDFNSLMHYSQWGFSNNGGKTISPKVGLTGVCYVGQRATLSPDDTTHFMELFDGAACATPEPEPECSPNNIRICGADTEVRASASIFREYEEAGVFEGYPFYVSLTPVYNTPMYLYRLSLYNVWALGFTVGGTSIYAINADTNVLGSTNWYRWTGIWESDPDTMASRVGCCVSSCNGMADGDYQSCNGCDVYITCSNGYAYDNRPCAPGGLVWDDNSKTCEYNSPTCP